MHLITSDHYWTSNAVRISIIIAYNLSTSHQFLAWSLCDSSRAFRKAIKIITSCALLHYRRYWLLRRRMHAYTNFIIIFIIIIRAHHSKIGYRFCRYAMDQCHLGCFNGWSVILYLGTVQPWARASGSVEVVHPSSSCSWRRSPALFNPFSVFLLSLSLCSGAAVTSLVVPRKTLPLRPLLSSSSEFRAETKPCTSRLLDYRLQYGKSPWY